MYSSEGLGVLGEAHGGTCYAYGANGGTLSQWTVMGLFRKGCDLTECDFKRSCCRGEEEMGTSVAVSLSLQAGLHTEARVPCTRVCTRAPHPHPTSCIG